MLDQDLKLYMYESLFGLHVYMFWTVRKRSCLFAFQPQPELPNKKPKNEEETFSNYRETHTANERRRRKEMRRLFEKLKVTLGLQMVPKVSKCFILKQVGIL